MATRFIMSVRKADTILKSGLFTRNCNNLAQDQPKCVELREFLSLLSAHAPKGFGKPFGKKDGNKNAASTASGIGTNPKSSAFSGGGDGRDGDEENSNAGPSSGGKNKPKVLVAFSTAGILGVCWWVYKDLKWKSDVQGFLGRSTVEFASMETQEKKKNEEALQKSQIVPLQEITGDKIEKQSVPENWAQLVDAANSTDPQIQYDAVTSVRELVSSRPNPIFIDSLVSCNILPTLVNCLSSPKPSVWALTSIVAGKHEQGQAVVQAGAVPHFLRLLTSPNQNVRYVAVCALANIIGAAGSQLRDYLISVGVVAPLLNCVQPDTAVTFLRHVTRAIRNLCSKDLHLPTETLREVLPTLSVLVYHSDTIVLADTIRAVINLAGEQIQMVIDSGVLPKLVQLLSHLDVEVQTLAVQAVANIASGTESQIQAVLNCNALSHFHSLLNHPKKDISKYALAVLSNISNGNCVQVQAVIDAGLIPLIIYHLKKGQFETQKAAARAVSNMTSSGNKEQVAYLIDCGVIPPFCTLLNSKDSEVTEHVLHGIYNILKMSVSHDGGDKVWALIAKCAGLDKIQSLQYHEDIKISKIAHHIIKNYFSEYEEKDANLAPEATENPLQLTPNAAKVPRK